MRPKGKPSRTHRTPAIRASSNPAIVLTMNVPPTRTLGARQDVVAHRLPPDVAKARTCLVWRRGHRSAALAALRSELARAAALAGT